MAEDKDKKTTPAAEEPEKGLSPEAKKKKKKEDDKKTKEAKKGPQVKKGDYGADFRYIVRLSSTDLDGTKKVRIALTSIKGVGHRMGGLVLRRAGVPATELIGNLKDEQVESLQKGLDTVAQDVPGWAVNRPLDYDSGDDLHLIGNNVEIVLRDDLNRLKKIRSYKGVRHEAGLPVRGQRTRANGRTGLTVGVQRQKLREAAAAKKAEEGGAKKEEKEKKEEKK